jgi:hypothetical protein
MSLVFFVAVVFVINICIAQQEVLVPRDSCTVALGKCMLDGKDATCYDDKDLVLAFGCQTTTKCEPYPLQCGWDVSTSCTTVGQLCRANGRRGACNANAQCKISDTSCSNGDRWCFVGGAAGQCEKGICIAKPITPPPPPPPRFTNVSLSLPEGLQGGCVVQQLLLKGSMVDGMILETDLPTVFFNRPFQVNNTGSNEKLVQLSIKTTCTAESAEFRKLNSTVC